MTNHKIAPRVDDDGVGWCDAGCPQCSRTARTLRDHATEIASHNCAVWDFWMSSFDICPVWAKRMVAEHRALRELIRRVYLMELNQYLDSEVFAELKAIYDTRPAAESEDE